MAIRIPRHTAQRIVDAISETCGYDCNYIDTNGVIFASTNEARIGTFHEVAAKVAKTGEMIEVDENSAYKGTLAGVNLPVGFHGEICAVIGISGAPSEVRKFALLAQRVTVMFLRERELNRQNLGERNEQEYVIRSLLEEKSLDYQYLTGFMEQYHLPENARYQVILIRMNNRYNPKNIPLIEQEIFRFFGKFDRKIFIEDYPDTFILVTTKENVKNNEKNLLKLCADNEHILKAGVGHSVPFLQIFDSYKTAGIAIDSAGPGENACFFTRMDLAILIAGTKEENAYMFCEKIIGNLKEDECNLLEIYFDTDGSLKETAERLFIHKNTLQYKLKQIETKTGYDPRTIRGAAKLLFALEIRKTKRRG